MTNQTKKTCFKSLAKLPPRGKYVINRDECPSVWDSDKQSHCKITIKKKQKSKMLEFDDCVQQIKLSLKTEWRRVEVAAALR